MLSYLYSDIRAKKVTGNFEIGFGRGGAGVVCGGVCFMGGENGRFLGKVDWY